jgi:hypothetical protein
MKHRYYQVWADGFWVEAHNPAWSDNYKLADAWHWRFRFFTGDKARDEGAMDFLRVQLGWDERLAQGTVLRLYEGDSDRASSLPDAGKCKRDLVHVVSPRAKQLFDRLGLSRELAYEQYPIYTPDGKIFLQNYCCVYYLVHISCADERLSYFHLHADGLDERIVLRRQLIGNHRVFLVDNHEVNVQVMREDVKEAIERAGLTGFRFEEVEVI